MASNKEFIQDDEEVNDWNLVLGHKFESRAKIKGMSYNKAKEIVKDAKTDVNAGYWISDKKYNTAVSVLGKRGMKNLEKEIYGL